MVMVAKRSWALLLNLVFFGILVVEHAFHLPCSPGLSRQHQQSLLFMTVTTVTSSPHDGFLTTPPNVWSVFSELAAETNACNLGQGFPDWDPPRFMIDSLIEAAGTNYHQYTRPAGHVPLVELIAKRYSNHLDRPIDSMAEVAITVGASQALYLAVNTLLKPGDEIVMFEPFFELYLKQIKLTGAIAKFVPLGGNGIDTTDPWSLNINALRSAITDQTKVLILNSPHNPTGKVFTKSEFEAIAEIVREFPNLTVISDEVYKFTVYDPIESGDPSSVGHFHFARLPDMWDRTITLSSCGKTFSVTGWQVGWMIAPKKFIKPVHEMLPSVQFCASTPIQHALTIALKQAELPFKGSYSFYEWQRLQFMQKRKIVEDGLKSIGIEPLPSQGGFFLMGKLPIRSDITQRARQNNEPYDWQYCKTLAREIGIIGIPASPFFTPGSKSYERFGPMARFAFCKKDDTLIEGMKTVKQRALLLKQASIL